jgi:ABC-type multidrug transport system ATPase subunit
MIEEPAFYPWLTGRQNLQVLGATGSRSSARQMDAREIARVLGLTGLTTPQPGRSGRIRKACASASALPQRCSAGRRC